MLLNSSAVFLEIPEKPASTSQLENVIKALKDKYLGTDIFKRKCQKSGRLSAQCIQVCQKLPKQVVHMISSTVVSLDTVTLGVQHCGLHTTRCDYQMFLLFYFQVVLHSVRTCLQEKSPPQRIKSKTLFHSQTAI